MTAQLFFAIAASLGASGQSEAGSTLARARHLADHHNWSEAAPLFAEAERAFGPGDRSDDAVIARCGRLRSLMEEQDLPDLASRITEVLENGGIAPSSHARMFCLAARGDVHGELEAREMASDWEAVRVIATRMGDRRMENRATGELSIPAFLQGDIVLARKLAGSSLLGAVSRRDWPTQARLLILIGNGMALAGTYEQALSYFDRALAITSKSRDFGYQFVLQAGRLLALRSLKRYGEAQTLAEEFVRQARARRRFVKETQGLIALAGIATDQGLVSKAETQLREAIAIADAHRLWRLGDTARFDLAHLLSDQGHLAEAEQLVTAALDRSSSSTELYALPRRLLTLAQLQVRQGKYESASITFEQAEGVIDGLLAANPNFSARSLLVSHMGLVYTQHFVFLAEHRPDVAKAFQVLESARARAMRDAITAGVPVQDEGPEIDREIAGLRLAVTRFRSPEWRREIGQKILALDHQRWLAHPNRAAYAALGSERPDLVGAQRMLAPDELLVGYVLAEPVSFALVVSAQSARLARLPSAATITEQADALYEAVARRRPFASAAAALSKALIDPLYEFKNYPNVTILREGSLHKVPFGLLRLGGGRSLLSSHVLSYAPSAGTLKVLRRAREALDKPSLLAIGGVPYDPVVSNVAASRGFSISGLGNLPGSRDEALLASKAIPGAGTKALIGVNATEGAFKRAIPNGYAVIHIAAHGVTNEQSPERAALLLASAPEESEDGILEAREIGQLRAKAQLVVLSACDTALGRMQGQEGVANLSRAFLVSGARSVVSTLWSIDDTFTLTFMRAFYRQIAAGHPPSVALTAAARSLVQRFAGKIEPYHYAGFILEGDGSQPLVLREKK